MANRESLINALNYEFHKSENELPNANNHESRYDQATGTMYCGDIVFEKDTIKAALKYFDNSYKILLAAAAKGDEKAADNKIRADYCKIAAEAIKAMKNLK